MSGICATPGCTNNAFKDASGGIGKYCRKTHKLYATATRLPVLADHLKSTTIDGATEVASYVEGQSNLGTASFAVAAT